MRERGTHDGPRPRAARGSGRIIPAGPVVLASALWVSLAAAGPPYATDDPQPADYRHFEVYLASQTSHDSADGWSGTLPHVEVNYGFLPDFHLHLLTPLVYAIPPGGKAAYGYGDTELGLKYSPVHEGAWVPRIGTYPILEVPTGSSAEGLGNGTAQLLLPVWFLKHFGDWATYGGAGIWFDLGYSDRHWVYVGWQVQRRLLDRLTVGAEVFLQTPAAPGAEADARFNLGAVLDITAVHHVMASAGRGFYGTNLFQAYVAYQVTFGPTEPDAPVAVDGE